MFDGMHDPGLAFILSGEGGLPDEEMASAAAVRMVMIGIVVINLVTLGLMALF